VVSDQVLHCKAAPVVPLQAQLPVLTPVALVALLPLLPAPAVPLTLVVATWLGELEAPLR
jgi:hypothetical protein